MLIDRHYGRLLSAIVLALGGGAIPLCIATSSCASQPPDYRCHPQDESFVVAVNGRICGLNETPSSSLPIASDPGDAGPPPCSASCEAACASTGRGGYVTCDPTVGARKTDAGDRISCTFHQMHACGRGFAELCAQEKEKEKEKEKDNNANDLLGAYFARAAWMEAASITAFRRLARELKSHEAPCELIHAARVAARDEARHARTMRRLAHRFGATTIARVEHRPLMEERSLEEIAIENATEACVGETYGAALAFWQSRRARDEGVRKVMTAIAEDELRHAALGHAIAEWAASLLDAQANDRVACARRAAVGTLQRELSAAAAELPSPSSFEAAGLPTAADARRLLHEVMHGSSMLSSSRVDAALQV